MKRVQLSFDEATHTYTDNEKNKYTSSTQLVGMVCEEFNTKFWSVYRALDQKGYKLHPKLNKEIIGIKFSKFSPPEYYHIDDLIIAIKNKTLGLNVTHEEVMEEWDKIAEIACDWGNDRHNYLEDCINDFYGKKQYSYSPRPDIPDSPDKKYKYKIVNEDELSGSPMKNSHPRVYALLLDLIKQGYVLYAERRVYVYEYKVSGTIDVLAIRGKDFIIIDWKTNKGKLHFDSGYYVKEWNEDRTRKIKTLEWRNTNQRLLYPLNHINDSKGSKYSLQLSLYAYICELWGLNCKGLILCHIRHDEDSDGNKYEIEPRIYGNIEYLKDDIRTLFNWHKKKNILGEKIVRKRGGIK